MIKWKGINDELQASYEKAENVIKNNEKIRKKFVSLKTTLIHMEEIKRIYENDLLYKCDTLEKVKRLRRNAKSLYNLARYVTTTLYDLSETLSDANLEQLDIKNFYNDIIDEVSNILIKLQEIDINIEISDKLSFSEILEIRKDVKTIKNDSLEKCLVPLNALIKKINHYNFESKSYDMAFDGNDIFKKVQEQIVNAIIKDSIDVTVLPFMIKEFQSNEFVEFCYNWRNMDLFSSIQNKVDECESIKTNIYGKNFDLKHKALIQIPKEINSIKEEINNNYATSNTNQYSELKEATFKFFNKYIEKAVDLTLMPSYWASLLTKTSEWEMKQVMPRKDFEEFTECIYVIENIGYLCPQKLSNEERINTLTAALNVLTNDGPLKLFGQIAIIQKEKEANIKKQETISQDVNKNEYEYSI